MGILFANEPTAAAQSGFDGTKYLTAKHFFRCPVIRNEVDNHDEVGIVGLRLGSQSVNEALCKTFTAREEVELEVVDEVNSPLSFP